MGFAKDLANFAAEFKWKGNRVLRRGIIRTGGRLVELSPVDTGMYVLNHRVGINRIDTTLKKTGFRLSGGRLRGGKRGPGARGPGITPAMVETLKKRFANAAARVKAGDLIYFTNNVPYAQMIEDGHSSQQAPNGVYSRVFEHVSNDFGGAVTGRL